MNKVILKGRLAADPEVTHTAGENPIAVARYRIAVNRRFKREGEPDADFINCVAFGKTGEFAQKYLQKGSEILITGRIQCGSYTNSEGQKRYTTDIIVEEHEFCGSKASNGQGETLSLAEQNDALIEAFGVANDDDLPF